MCVEFTCIRNGSFAVYAIVSKTDFAEWRITGPGLEWLQVALYYTMFLL